jgi:hypothetical protein
MIEKNALVIRVPNSSFVELKGAQAEADAVARSLTGGLFRVELRRRATEDHVMHALYARPYQVLHLAGIAGKLGRQPITRALADLSRPLG